MAFTTSMGIALGLQGAKETQRQLKEINKYVEKAARGMDKASTSAGKLSRAFKFLVSGYIAKQIFVMADSFTYLVNRLGVVSNSLVEVYSKIGTLARISNNTFTDMKVNTAIYTRFALAGKAMGATTAQLMTATESLARATLVSGSNTEEARGAFIQLSQAFGSAQLRGQELTSTIEQIPRLATALAEFKGIRVGDLREAGAAGDITSVDILNTLISYAKRFKQETRDISPTLQQAFGIAYNNAVLFVGMLDKAVGFTKALSTGMNSLTGHLPALAVMLTPFAEDLGRLLDGAIALFKESFKYIFEDPSNYKNAMATVAVTMYSLLEPVMITLVEKLGELLQDAFSKTKIGRLFSIMPTILEAGYYPILPRHAATVATAIGNIVEPAEMAQMRINTLTEALERNKKAAGGVYESHMSMNTEFEAAAREDLGMEPRGFFAKFLPPEQTTRAEREKLKIRSWELALEDAKLALEDAIGTTETASTAVDTLMSRINAALADSGGERESLSSIFKELQKTFDTSQEDAKLFSTNIIPLTEQLDIADSIKALYQDKDVVELENRISRMKAAWKAAQEVTVEFGVGEFGVGQKFANSIIREAILAAGGIDTVVGTLKAQFAELKSTDASKAFEDMFGDIISSVKSFVENNRTPLEEARDTLADTIDLKRQFNEAAKNPEFAAQFNIGETNAVLDRAVSKEGGTLALLEKGYTQDDVDALIQSVKDLNAVAGDDLRETRANLQAALAAGVMEDPNATATAIAKITKEIDALRLASSKSGMDGIARGFNTIKEEATDFAATTENMVVGAFNNMSSAMSDFVKTGQLDFTSLIDSMIDGLVRLALQQAVLGFFGGNVGTAFAGIFHAKGGVLNRPTHLGGGHIGGEAGPEGLLPLRTMANGDLGVQMAGSSGTVQNVTINVAGGSSGNKEQDKEYAAMISREIRNELRSMTEATIRDNMRSGGILNRQGTI